MRNWAAFVMWVGVCLGGGVVATVGQDRWLIAGGGALVGVSPTAGVTLLLWSLVLRKLVRWLREMFHDLHDLREFMEGRVGWERSGRNAPYAPPDRYGSANSPWRW
jgi:hypothetical protein